MMRLSVMLVGQHSATCTTSTTCSTCKSAALTR